MHIFFDRIIKSLRHSVLVKKKAYFSFAKRVTHRENMKEENGKRVGDGQEKWNKKKRLNF